MDFIETTAANQLSFPPMVPKCILKKGRKIGGHLTICDNDDCDITSDDQRLRRCTKCRYTFYCSKDCQVKAWCVP
ncbi:MYND-type zinc finger protein samB [Abortiporus biennis]